MQKEIKKRVKLYGVAAVLLTVMLVSLCYQFGYIPRTQPTPQSSSLMSTFSSYDELREFLETRSKVLVSPYYYSDVRVYLGPTATLADLNVNVFSAGATPLGTTSEVYQHSTTNVQVTGVDEEDTVKTDDMGFIYLIVGSNVSILKAYPPDNATLVSTITFSDIVPTGLFVNGDRLAVFGSKGITAQPTFLNPGIPASTRVYISKMGYYYSDTTTYVKIYDISDRTNPQLLTTLTASGEFVSSRMIGQYVYFVSSQLAFYTIEIIPNLTIDKMNIPKIEVNGNEKEVAANEIQYTNTTDDSYLFTTVVAFNIQNTTESPSYKTIMLGGTSAMYVSINNMYVTFPANGRTSIYRIHIENNTITPESQGEVPGSVLNQFSMDEYDNYFRIATTTWENWTSQHNVFVLNMNMSIIGNLTGLAPKENFHAARFMGNRCYLVTFEKIDPLFVIDLTDPTKPTVLGELWIPGYSDYLHPYDENHLIGVGKETVSAEQGFFSWYQGIKIALFDVSNVSNPTQMASYTIGERGSDSLVLRDHKAFLFDKTKNLLVIPALEARVDRTQYPGEVPPYAYGQPVWQGAYVFNVTLENGFQLRGNITHMENGINIYNGSFYVKRSLYIENVLYTISDVKVKLNNLDDLTFIKEIRVD